MCKNAHCSHDCRPTADGPVCFCPEGRRPEGGNCVDTDECQLDNTCAQMCTNTVGSFLCSCVSGYQKDGQNCIAINVPQSEKPSIIFSTLNTVQRITLEGNPWSNTTQLKSLNSHALDFSHRNRTLYYIHQNLTKSALMGINIDNFNDRWELPSPSAYGKLSQVQQIALDWVSENWYLLDDNQEIILLCNKNLDKCKVIIEKNLDKPKSLALDPTIGYMYFSRWGNSPPVIERCQMDGSNRVALIDYKIVFPYGITVDYSTSQVYWLDTFLDMIEKIDFDGKNRRTIKQGPIVQNLYGISYFERDLYVSSWKDNTIFKIDTKLQTETIVEKISRPYYLHVFHRQRQPDGK
ncbi:vitellogenin receptor-like protein-related-related [Holotrichia oblita]|uniref:Vitellogenin receptor-like protein-related-related n=1 Tax=Holotrichia oblita TaxID=644536 RepID=A0ACB9TQ72_HOLOL|nr:vitellogenin receptor-like protein-related-related [Holotrichia oblita]